MCRANNVSVDELNFRAEAFRVELHCKPLDVFHVVLRRPVKIELFDAFD